MARKPELNAGDGDACIRGARSKTERRERERLTNGARRGIFFRAMTSPTNDMKKFTNITNFCMGFS